MAEVSKETQKQIESVISRRAHALASWQVSMEQAAQAFKALAIAVTAAEIKIIELAKHRRAGLREKLGWFCIFVPEWWAWRRIDQLPKPRIAEHDSGCYR